MIFENASHCTTALAPVGETRLLTLCVRRARLGDLCCQPSGAGAGVLRITAGLHHRRTACPSMTRANLKHGQRRAQERRPALPTTSRDGKPLTVSTAEIGVGVLVDAPQPNQARSQRVWKTNIMTASTKKLETIHWDASEQLQRHPAREAPVESRDTPECPAEKAHGVLLYDLKGRCACGKRGCASN